MKTIEDFSHFIKERILPLDTEIFVAIRKSTFSDVEYLKLIITGNSLYASDRKENANDIQLRINTVGEFLELIEKANKNRNERKISNFDNLFYLETAISPGINLDNRFIFSTGRENVKDFVLLNSKVIFEINNY